MNKNWEENKKKKRKGNWAAKCNAMRIALCNWDAGCYHFHTFVNVILYLLMCGSLISIKLKQSIPSCIVYGEWARERIDIQNFLVIFSVCECVCLSESCTLRIFSISISLFVVLLDLALALAFLSIWFRFFFFFVVVLFCFTRFYICFVLRLPSLMLMSIAGVSCQWMSGISNGLNYQ